MNNKIEEWLMENGGPAIQLRLSALQNSSNAKNDIDNSVAALISIEGVHSVLNYLDGFKASGIDKKSLEHLIHYYKDTCIDSFFPLIMDMGFKAGVPIFDEKIAPVTDIFKYLVAFANEYDYCFCFALMLHRFFFMSGFLFPELIESMNVRINAIHKSAEEHILDIYQDDSKLPKKPQIWSDVGVLKDELNPFSSVAAKPLPTIYDVSAMAYYADICTDPEITKKIDDIITYILDPEFQKIRLGYGVLWVKARRIYIACGWSPTLPLFESDGRLIRLIQFPALEYLDVMSHFKTARKSEWFHDCLNHFEQFKTEKGTYIFPNEYHYLHKKYIDRAFLNETNMSLKRNERELKKRELVSTMKMLEIYRRIEI
jgi:hypothetical protein